MMSDETPKQEEAVTFHSARFGELSVTPDSIIEFPVGVIGFPRARRFVMLDYKPPFSWLHSIEDPNLAFVVVDGFEFAANYGYKPPIGDRDCDLQEGDEYAILVVVTVRPDPRETTANLKAPLYVNIRNRKGVQVIFDNPNLSTRQPLWEPSDKSAKKEESEKKE